MTNSIDIKYRADTSQSVVATDKLLARITKLEGQLSTAVGKSSKVGSALGKSYADAEVRVKHFEKALKSATSVTTKYRALEGLQEAVRAFKIAKADFEDSMKVGHDPGLAIDKVAQATSKLSAAQTNAWNAEQSQLRASASLRQDIISRMTAQVALEKQLSQDKAIASAKELATVQANSWNAEQSRLREAAALRQDIISRLTAQVALERKLEQTKAADMIGRFGAWQDASKPSPMISQMNAFQSQQKMQADAARRQQMLDRDAQVVERQKNIARARELDQKYASRYSSADFAANNRRGMNVFDSEATLTDRRSLLNDRMQKASPDSLAYKNMLAELTQIEAALKRIKDLQKQATSSSKPMAAVELGSAKALTQQIKYLKAEMSKVGAGPQWDTLNAKLAKAQTELDGMAKKADEAKKSLSEAATAPHGSWVRLDYELEKAKDELSKLTFGTKEFLAQQSKVRLLQYEWDQVNTAVNKTMKSQKDSNGLMGSLVGQAKTLALTYFGVHQAMQKVTSEYNKWKAFELSVANKGIELEAQIVKQSANIDATDRPAAKQWALDNAGALMSKPEDSYEVLGVALSSGGETLARSKKLAESVLPLTVGDKEQAIGLAIASGVITSENQSDNYKAGTMQIRQFGQRSMGIDEKQFDENTMKAMAAKMRNGRKVDGMSSERVLEDIAEASHIVKDIAGDKSATALISELGAFDDFTAKAKGKLKDKTRFSVDPAIVKQFNESRDYDERKKLLQQNKGLGDQFIDTTRRGLPRAMVIGMLDTSPKAEEKRAWIKEGIDNFNVAGGKWDAEAQNIRESVPQLVERRTREAEASAARQRGSKALEGEAWATYDALLNGEGAVNLTGIDEIPRAKAEVAMQQYNMEMRKKNMAALTAAGVPADQWAGHPLNRNGNQAGMFRRGVGVLLQEEKAAGGEFKNPVVYDILQKTYESLQRQEKQLEQLNAQVAAGKGNPPAGPRAVAPVAKAPPVPRMPAMNFNAPGGDVFGWFKK